VSVALADAWLRCYRPAPAARLRLVCMPHSGGGASFFRAWALAAPASVELVSVQYPGREDRTGDPPVAHMLDLADHIERAIAQLEPLPVALFGHSLGAAVAHEVARLHEARGSELVRLVVSGRGAPRRLRHETSHLLDDEALWADVRRLGGTDDTLLDSAELRALVLPALRSDLRLVETYRAAPGPPVTAPIGALVGDRDPKASVAEVAGWWEETTGAFALRVVPGGDHFYLARRRDEALHEVLRLLDVVPAPAAGPPGP
jgi:pyochelin biosynthetic protein PchC